ncbi:hypothetical protein PILCRDRAFT_820809 [Piloderma croceum F 1598]|uniref:Uncharacterized protein n=1 Tax=Piloderma croceum (strain F 1598) TaxID=765440 RepID=A0A0C3FB76_PILCF|nr:hypothetical protein PILCRDRAFT_820809 [Piloderma croceum F 1598]
MFARMSSHTPSPRSLKLQGSSKSWLRVDHSFMLFNVWDSNISGGDNAHSSYDIMVRFSKDCKILRVTMAEEHP